MQAAACSVVDDRASRRLFTVMLPQLGSELLRVPAVPSQMVPETAVPGVSEADVGDVRRCA